MPRSCEPIPNEFRSSYASVVVSPDLAKDISDLEKGPLLSAFTSWCSICQRPYLLTTSMGLFHLPSAHHAHMLVLSRRLSQDI